MKTINLLCILLGIIAFFSCCTRIPEKSLEEIFEQYTAAIQKSDLEALFETVTDDAEFYFLTSRGKLLTTRDGYYQFHQRWFADSAWTISFDLQRVREFQNSGFTIAIFDYRQKTSGGKEVGIKSYFTLIFKRQKGRWQAVADICTPIIES